MLSTFMADKYIFELGHNLFIPLFNYGFWAFLSPLVWKLVLRYRPDKQFTYKKLFVWIGGGIVLSFIHELATNILYHGMVYITGNLQITQTLVKQTFNSMLGAVFSRFMEYWMIFFGLTIWGYYQAFKKQRLKLAQVKAELFETKLEALKAQLQPHFLFNTLNSVSALMTKDIQQAQKVLSNLAQLLRTLFKHDGDHMVTLSEELEFIQSYLEIEQIRFSDRLKVHYQVHPETRYALVPKLILQPLVENSLKHGISKNSKAGEIIISSVKSNGFLSLTVSDNGRGVVDSGKVIQSHGVGLNNIRERLKQLYEEEMSMEIAPVAPRGFKVNLAIPFEQN